MYKRINITLPEGVLARADGFAASERYTRSGLIAAALQAFIDAESTGAIPPGPGGASVAEEAPAAYGDTGVCAPAPAAPPRGPALDRVAPLLHAFFSARDDVEAAWVFGSVARGETWAMSDVDIAILPAANIEREAWWDLRLSLMSRLPGVLEVPEVDVVAMPEVSVTLGFEIASQDVQVFGEGSRRSAEAIIAAITEYWDYAEVRSAAHRALGDRVRAYAQAE